MSKQIDGHKPGRYEMVPVGELIPYVNNARTHSDGQLVKLQASIREFGFVNPVLIDGSKNIIAGHGRVEAAKREGIDEVPCVFVEHLTDTQRKAYILADNRLAEDAGWDMDVLNLEIKQLMDMGFDIGLTGFDGLQDFDSSVEIKDPPFDIDEEIAAIDEPVARRGNMWSLGRHKLMCGDSTDVTDVGRLMGDNVADMMLTDPPYNVDYEGNAGKIQNDKQGDYEFFEFLKAAFLNANQALKPGGAFYIWHAGMEACNFWTACREAGLTIHQCLVWVKSSLVMGRQDYQWIHEPCLYGWKEGAAHYFIDDRKQTTVYEDAPPNIRKMKKSEMESLLKEIYSDKISTSVIKEDKPSRSELHPTMKPIKLMARNIKNSSKAGQIVLDLFGGSGSTLIACEQLNRTCYMMELDPKYCDVIIKRWENLTGQKAVLNGEV